MGTRPSGTVTFLFTDIEGSTRLWDSDPAAMQQALVRHDEILRGAIDAHGGYVFSTGGDGVGAAFQRADDAVAAALDAQRGLAAEPWSSAAVLRVRMGLHTGETHERDGDYFGPPVDRAARVMGAGNGGQVVVSGVTAALVRAVPGLELIDLGEHVLKGLRESTHIFGLAAPGCTWIDRPLAVSTATGNLPVPITEYVGDVTKTAEQIGALSQRRLVTLVGPGGVGKTRTAIELAWFSLEQFPAGAWFVDFAALTEPSAVPMAIAAVLDVRPEPGAPVVDALVDWVRGRQLLLVLDNCEHVLQDARSVVATLIASSPTLTVLATSREPLGARGERIHLVAGLDPDAEAIELFIERARAADDAFAVSSADRATIASICARLDGMPLAIELAAARVRSTTPADLLGRLDNVFRVLRGARRGGTDRHETLLATIAWSYELLSPDEQLVFDRLSVFAGNFDRPAVEAVCADETLDALDVTDLFDSLVDKSMVLVVRRDDVTRFRLLETLRQFAAERLDERGETPVLRDRHLRHFIDLARTLRTRTFGPDQAAATDDFFSAWSNICAAQRWATASGDLQAAGLILGLTMFAAVRTMRIEHRDLAERTIAASTGVAVLAECSLTIWAWMDGAPQLALDHAARALDVPEAFDDAADESFVEAWICRGLAELSIHGERSVEATGRLRALTTSPVLFTRCDALRSLVETSCSQTPRPPTLGEDLARLDDAARQLGMPAMLAEAAYLRAIFVWLSADPDYEAVRGHFAENIRLARQVDDTYNEHYTLAMLCAVALVAGDADVDRLCRDTLLVSIESRHRQAINKVLPVLAIWFAQTGNLDAAARLLGYVDAQQVLVWHVPLDEARRGVDDPRWERARADGAGLDAMDAAAFALAELERVSSLG